MTRLRISRVYESFPKALCVVLFLFCGFCSCGQGISTFHYVRSRSVSENMLLNAHEIEQEVERIQAINVYLEREVARLQHVVERASSQQITCEQVAAKLGIKP